MAKHMLQNKLYERLPFFRDFAKSIGLSGCPCTFIQQTVIVSETDLMTVITAMSWDSLLIWSSHIVSCWFYMPGGLH